MIIFKAASTDHLPGWKLVVEPVLRWLEFGGYRALILADNMDVATIGCCHQKKREASAYIKSFPFFKVAVAV